MSAPVHPTVEQIADTYGISRRMMFHAIAVRRYGCDELNQAAQLGLLPLKHCETVAKTLSHDDQREFLKQLPMWTPRKRHDILTVLKEHLKAQRAGGSAHV